MAINKQSIISAFDDKLTLLQWLKTIHEALENAVITGFESVSVDATHIKLKINFADGTSVETDNIELPQGPQGEKGDTGEQGPQGPAGDGTKLYKHSIADDSAGYYFTLISNSATPIDFTQYQNYNYLPFYEYLNTINVIAFYDDDNYLPLYWNNGDNFFHSAGETLRYDDWNLTVSIDVVTEL